MDLNKSLSEISGVKVLFNERMSLHTTMGVGGVADFFAVVETLKGLRDLIDFCERLKINRVVVGNGSNLLVSDNGFRGIVVSLGKIDRIYPDDDEIKVMAGAKLGSFVSYCSKNGYSGVERLCGIPATVGGAVVMNAGAFGQRICDNLSFVEVLIDGKIKRIYNEDCDFSYRSSRFLNCKEIIVSATFKLKREFPCVVEEKEKTFLSRRTEMFPKGKSCGSVFKNPEGMSAGKIIEESGLKGFYIGGARVSEKHGNFIITDKRATAADVSNLICLVKQMVLNKKGVTLSEEVVRIGDF